MSELQHFTLNCPHQGAPVRHQVSLVGSPAGPGVQAWVYTEGKTRIALIADMPNNPGVSATNGFEVYAEAVCRAARSLPLAWSEVTWFEFDSMGSFDEVEWVTDSVRFGPLREGAHQPRSKEAFLARMWRLAPRSVPLWQEVLQQLEEQSA